MQGHACTRKQHKADSTCSIYQTGLFFFFFFLCDPAMSFTCHWKHSQLRDDLPLRHIIMKFATDTQRQADGRGEGERIHSTAKLFLSVKVGRQEWSGEMDCGYCSVSRLRIPDSDNVPPFVLPHSPPSIIRFSSLPISDPVTLFINGPCWQSTFPLSVLSC